VVLTVLDAGVIIGILDADDPDHASAGIRVDLIA